MQTWFVVGLRSRSPLLEQQRRQRWRRRRRQLGRRSCCTGCPGSPSSLSLSLGRGRVRWPGGWSVGPARPAAGPCSLREECVQSAILAAPLCLCSGLRRGRGARAGGCGSMEGSAAAPAGAVVCSCAAFPSAPAGTPRCSSASLLLSPFCVFSSPLN